MSHFSVPAPQTQPLLFTPGELLRCGLTDAHERPLVGVRTDAGDVRSWRTSPFRAWSWPLVEWGRTGNSYAALVLDCDSRESVELAAACAVDAGPLPRPSVIATRKASGHCHAAWMLRSPVHRGEAARRAPLQLFGRTAEFYRSALRADAGFVGVLAANPTHADYATAWLRTDPLELRALAAAVPHGWRMPAGPKLTTDPGRNCFLFRSLCSTGIRYDDADLDVFAARLNDGLSHPLPAGELAGIVRSVMRYRARWRSQGHQPAFLFRQAARGRRGGFVSGQSRRLGTPLEHDPQPWKAAGMSRRTWYRQRAKAAGESRGAKVGTEANTGSPAVDRPGGVGRETEVNTGSPAQPGRSVQARRARSVDLERQRQAGGCTSHEGQSGQAPASVERGAATSGALARDRVAAQAARADAERSERWWRLGSGWGVV